jgi:hypothetical protein
MFKPQANDGFTKTSFETIINDKLCLFDFSDFEELSQENIDKYKAIFKFHYNKIKCLTYENVFPFTPINFYDWKKYSLLENKIKYNAIGKIYNRQAIYGNAIHRRQHVRDILQKKFNNVDFTITSQEQFFNDINNCLISVCVPGARNNMLDRGQSQYMFFGACTISPKLDTILSYNQEIIPNEHYIECRKDYSNLIELIETNINNKNKLINIGHNAKHLLKKTSTPMKQKEWIKQCIK